MGGGCLCAVGSCVTLCWQDLMADPRGGRSTPLWPSIVVFKMSGVWWELLGSPTKLSSPPSQGTASAGLQELPFLPPDRAKWHSAAQFPAVVVVIIMYARCRKTSGCSSQGSGQRPLGLSKAETTPVAILVLPSFSKPFPVLVVGGCVSHFAAK